MANQRRIVMFNRVTADGYFAGPNGTLDWFVPEPAMDDQAAQSLAGFDTFLFGRRTYEMFAGFWPHALEPGRQGPHGGGTLQPAQRAMARALNGNEKLVFSTTLKELTWENSRLSGRIDRAEIEALKRRAGKDLMILGSGSLVAQLTEQGLIDEYQLLVCPLFLGSGQSLLGGLERRAKLALLEAKPFPGGSVLLRFARSA